MGTCRFSPQAKKVPTYRWVSGCCLGKVGASKLVIECVYHKLMFILYESTQLLKANKASNIHIGPLKVVPKNGELMA